MDDQLEISETNKEKKLNVLNIKQLKNVNLTLF